MSKKVAVSDLQSRLDFLVAYSSQLVFVANDDLQFQQSTLQTFIAQQHENLEVAFLKGEPNRSEEDYRKEICRQILHKTTGQFDDSLRTVLQNFDTIENPVLICICAAQQIPHKLLKELWELVLLARTLNKNLHVNVVLFGDCEWVNDAKKKLPVNSGNKPVILSTELDGTHVNQNEAQEQSELEALIATKRAAFAERVQARSSITGPRENIPSLIQTRKFQIAVGLAFLATFATLVFWFYPQQPELTTKNSDVKTQIDAPVATVAPVLDEPANPTLTVESIEPDETVETVESDKSLLDPSNEPVADTLLVTQWQSPEVAEPQIDLEPAELSKLEDKPESDQIELFATDEQAIPPELRSTEKPVTSPSVHPLEKIEQGQFLIQISSTGNLQAAEQFVKQNSLQETIWIYTTTRIGKPWHVIVFKTLFQSKSEARNYIATLSDQLKNSSPFIKSIEKIQEEIAIAN